MNSALDRDSAPGEQGIMLETVEVDGYAIRTALAVPTEAGSTLPLFVFNGFGVTLGTSLSLMSVFRGRPVLTFDVPGVGGSPTPVLPLRLRKLAHIAANLLEHFGYQQADVLGFSWGGFLAQEFAYRYKDRVQRLVLVATTPGTLMVPGLKTLTELVSSPRDLETRKARHSEDLGVEAEHALEAYYDPANYDDSPTARFYQSYACWGWTSAHWLHRLPHATLILAGTRDPIVPMINARYMALQIPDSRLVEVDSGHLFLYLLREQSVTIIDHFLSG